ncbi:MAG: PEP-CTERM sorting domain-containing protein [Acidobacteria bacterium]|nr:PEP-CTERM sorting domain-containing protein [Acidobacteriota bacterium]
MNIGALAGSLFLAVPIWAGSVFLTGHDPDFHAHVGGNVAGAIKINQTAIGYVTDPGFNPFKAGGINKFLFVESNIPIPGGHVRGKSGIVASGYTEGVDFDHHDATTLNAALNQLGTVYNAIVVASDFGGTLTQAELDILNARGADIIGFLNAGGGLYAMSQSNSGGSAQLTPGGGHYGFLPFIVTSVNLDMSETGYTVTAFGASLGLSDADVNGNFSHAIFTSTGGMSIVDVDSTGRILSLATRNKVTPTGVVPEPGTYAMMAAGVALLLLRRRR